MDKHYTSTKKLLSTSMLSTEQKNEFYETLPTLKNFFLNKRHLCDIELILNGGFSPLVGFVNQRDYLSILTKLCLEDGTIWPIPITLDVTTTFAYNLIRNEQIALRDPEGILIAIMQVTDIWEPDKIMEAESIFGTTDPSHPGVNYLLNQSGEVYLGGQLFGFNLPKHYDNLHLRHSPNELRELFNKLSWNKIVAFQTRNPMHKAHQELTFRAAREMEANLLIHPVVGMTKPGDIDHYTRVRCYEKLLLRYPEQTTRLSLLPLAMRMAGPKEALWHVIIRKNYGCTHFIVGRDHAGPGKNCSGEDFYGHYDAQEFVKSYETKIGVIMVPFQEMVYVANKAEYYPVNKIEDQDKVLKISGTEFRRRLMEGLDIPEWFSYPEIITELRKTHPPKHQQGFTVFFTGLSGAGKSTIANALLIKLMEVGDRSITLLDGDVVRKNLSSELGFSKEHRDLNIFRIGYVAKEITKHRGVAICASIAPYEKIRKQVKEMVSEVGGFIEVFVSTPLEICEERDIKGLYVKARAGIITGFTGIDDPYEPPTNPDCLLDTRKVTPEAAAQEIILKLEHMGYLKKNL